MCKTGTCYFRIRLWKVKCLQQFETVIILGASQPCGGPLKADLSVQSVGLYVLKTSEEHPNWSSQNLILWLVLKFAEPYTCLLASGSFITALHEDVHVFLRASRKKVTRYLSAKNVSLESCRKKNTVCAGHRLRKTHSFLEQLYARDVNWIVVFRTEKIFFSDCNPPFLWLLTERRYFPPQLGVSIKFRCSWKYWCILCLTTVRPSCEGEHTRCITLCVNCHRVHEFKIFMLSVLL
jgi:hypothetical protein